MSNSLVPSEKDRPVETLIAESLLPYYLDGSKKSLYLSYRVCGFGKRESQRLADVSQRTVLRWYKKDPDFKSADTDQLPAIRRRLGADFTQLEFLRNFRLLLRKDFDVINKSIGDGELTKQEEKYLLAARKLYTPQQLGVLKQILTGGGAPASFDFTTFIKELHVHRGRSNSVQPVVEAEFQEVDHGEDT